MEVDEHGRPHPPGIADEVTTLRGFLDHQRATLAWKTSGLAADGLTVTTAATSMTLGGLLKHMAWVEDYWFVHVLQDRAPSPPWDKVDWANDPDFEWHSAAGDVPAQLRGLWEQACRRSRDAVDKALANGGLEQVAAGGDPDQGPSLRWIMLHMIEEYARHNGHADLLREAIDGLVGE